MEMEKNQLSYFKQMEKENVQPDSITFVSLLIACSHTGLVDDALYYFNSMKNQFQVTPDVMHYTCLVDTLCRAGHLEEAENVIKEMKEPDSLHGNHTWCM